MEVIADLQEKMGIELSEEAGRRITHIGQLIDEFYGMIIEKRPAKKGKK
jgi:acyl carrier protein